MNGDRFQSTFKFLIPQSVTALRLLLASGALMAISLGKPEHAATLIVLGVATDGLDGSLARRLDVASDFGALFDYFADYLCYVVAPVLLILSSYWQGSPLLQFLMVSPPLLTGALRYTKLDGLRREGSCEKSGYPGVPTVFFACFVCALLFLDYGHAVGQHWIGPTLLAGSLLLAILMVAPVAYPKLVKFKSILLPIVIGLCIMPFFLREILAGLTVFLTAAYVLIGPLLCRPQRETRGEEAHRWPERRET
jgi:CDP-diacylglycerol--serine O-phosphatidyltransferase